MVRKTVTIPEGTQKRQKCRFFCVFRPAFSTPADVPAKQKKCIFAPLFKKK